jgi:AcrR family transcriptional regulator
MMTTRSRNPRGEGGKLRDEILNAARSLAEEQGVQAMTLRGVARRVGIAAPSIYSHFPDRDALLSALVDEALAEFTTEVSAAMGAETDPVDSLRAGCTAYLDFAMRRPNSCQLAFGPLDANLTMTPSGTTAFELLVNAVDACVRAGVSVSTDPFADATAIWVALHGYAILHTTRPAFPWPPTDAIIGRIIHGLASLSASPSSRRQSQLR